MEISDEVKALLWAVLLENRDVVLLKKKVLFFTVTIHVHELFPALEALIGPPPEG